MSLDHTDLDPTLVLSWSEIWVKAVTEPSEETYREIIFDPGASNRKANTWMFLAAMGGWVLNIILGTFLGTSILAGQLESAPIAILSTMVCAVPMAGVMAVISLIISSGIIQGIARLLGGEGQRKELAVGMAAYLAPLSLVSSLISTIPIIGAVSYLISLYALVLNVIAVKSLNRFEWWKAVIASLGVFLVIVGVAVVVILLLVFLGPAIGEIFKSLR